MSLNDALPRIVDEACARAQRLRLAGAPIFETLAILAAADAIVAVAARLA